MTQPLYRHCVLALLLSMAAATFVGLVAYGSVPALGAGPATPLAAALPHLPLLLAAAWGWRVQARVTQPAHLRRPQRAFHALVLAGASCGMAQALATSPVLEVASLGLLAGAYVVLATGLLAERVDPRFGRPAGLAAALAGVMLATLVTMLTAAEDDADVRALLFMQLAPLLVVPAGVLGLPGRLVRRSDWLVLFAIYVVALVLGLADAGVLAATGWVRGKTLMPLALTAATVWWIYVAEARRSAQAGSPSQRKTSWNTAS